MNLFSDIVICLAAALCLFMFYALSWEHVEAWAWKRPSSRLTRLILRGAQRELATITSRFTSALLQQSQSVANCHQQVQVLALSAARDGVDRQEELRHAHQAFTNEEMRLSDMRISLRGFAERLADHFSLSEVRQYGHHMMSEFRV